MAQRNINSSIVGEAVKSLRTFHAESLNPQDWQPKAGCIDADPEIFFIKSAREDAKKVCGQCAVRMTCLAFALEHSEEYGVWGGLDEDERGLLKRKLQRHRIS